jgi:hypothetical protein
MKHGVQKSFQEAFFQQIKALVAAIEERGNPFMEDSNQLSTLDTKDFADQAVVNTVQGIKVLGIGAVRELHKRTSY